MILGSILIIVLTFIIMYYAPQSNAGLPRSSQYYVIVRVYDQPPFDEARRGFPQ